MIALLATGLGIVIIFPLFQIIGLYLKTFQSQKKVNGPLDLHSIYFRSFLCTDPMLSAVIQAVNLDVYVHVENMML